MVLDEEPLRGRQRQGERMLGHRFCERTPVRSDGALRRQGLQGDKIDPSGVELQQPHPANEGELIGGQILRRMLRKDDIGPPQHIGPLRGRHIGEVQNVGHLTDRLTDHTPADTLHVEHHH